MLRLIEFSGVMLSYFTFSRSIIFTEVSPTKSEDSSFFSVMGQESEELFIAFYCIVKIPTGIKTGDETGRERRGRDL